MPQEAYYLPQEPHIGIRPTGAPTGFAQAVISPRAPGISLERCLKVAFHISADMDRMTGDPIVVLNYNGRHIAVSHREDLAPRSP